MNLRDEYEAACLDYDPEPDIDLEQPAEPIRYSCSDRMCGSDDCWNCKPWVAAELEGEE